jgi:hypothetical protein
MAFVKNTELNEELLNSHEYGHLTERAYNLFHSLIKHRIDKLVKYDKEIHCDAIQVKAIEKIELVWQNYKFTHSNAYAYFVSTVDNVIKRFFIDNPTMLRIDNNLADFAH